MSRYGELEVTITSAKDLKNVNWRHGPIRPYVVIWVDPARKLTTRVDEEGDAFPQWDQTLIVPLNAPPSDSTLYIDVVQAGAKDDVKPLIGSARLPLRDVLDDPRGGVRKLDLRRPSGRPHGKITVEATLRGSNRYGAPDAYRSGTQYGGARDYEAPDPYRSSAYRDPYDAPPPPPTTYASPYAAAAVPAAGYPYGGAPVAQPGYGQPSYGQTQPAYGQTQPAYGQTQSAYGQGSYGGYGQQQADQPKKSKFGMGTGLAVGAVAGVLGGLALSEGVDALENHISNEAAEKVEDQEYYDGDDVGDDDGGGW
ncbi:hypothetical protein Droror1_Dr00013191 [Drosera rotundifolia]